MSNYPAGVTDDDPEFSMPSVDDDDLNAGLENRCGWPTRCLMAGEHQRSQCYTVETDEDDNVLIPCSLCGKPTTYDTTYGDLCGRCCRAGNE